MMKRLNPLPILALGSLPGALWAHGGLEHASAFMLFFHGLAHAINEHPVTTALLSGAVVVAVGLQRRRSKRRISP
jgi:hypothetical protein